MNDKWRQTAIHEKITRKPVETNTLSRHEFSWKLLLAVFAYSILLTIPFLWLNAPANIYIGAVSNSDLVSRVDFYWQKPDKEKISQNVLAEHYPLYEERARGEWVEDVFAPVAAILEQAADNCGIDILIQRAAKGGMVLGTEAAGTICEYVNKEMRGGLYADLINPSKQVLYEWVYKQGVIDAERYAEEMKDGKHFIEIVDAGEHVNRGRLTEIGSDSTSAPVSSAKIGPLIKKGVYDYLLMVKPEMRTVLINLLTARVAARPTLVYQAALTKARLDERLQQELRRSSHVLKNSLLIAKGQTVSAEDFTKITAENQAWLAACGINAVCGRLTGKLLLIFFTAIFFTALFYFLVPTHRQRKLFGVAIVSLALLLPMYYCLQYGIAINLLPVGVLAGLTAFGCGAGIGMLTVAFFCLLVILLDVQQFDAIASFLISGCFFAWLAPLQRFRMGLAKITVFSAAAAVIAVVCWTVSEGMKIEWPYFTRLTVFFLDSGSPVIRAFWSVGGWIQTLVILLIGMRALRPLFGVTNNIMLQDLQEHPLLTRLLTEAPSTYFHCSLTAALAEAAARSIGANSVLCRIASLYHDIGKLTKPEYFTENEKGVSRHDSLSPYMSNLIIISHVKDGAEIARQCHLPSEITDVIAQHHGTTQVGFFLRRAKEEAVATQSPVDETLFRYPGPLPQSPEAAIIMIADSVEAASRSMADAAPAHIRALVNKIAMGKLSDHQLDASGLNFTDLARIEDALTMMLTSMFHSRVSYDQSGKKRNS